MKLQKYISFIMSLSHSLLANAQAIIVAKDGSGKFKTIQEAINSVSLADSAGNERVVFIKNGTYNEKIFIEKKHFLTLKGESEKGVI